MFVVYILLCFLLGFLLGRLNGSRSDGVIVVDDSDEETTHWTLQYNKDPNDLPKKKSIRLRVHVLK